MEFIDKHSEVITLTVIPLFIYLLIDLLINILISKFKITKIFAKSENSTIAN